MEAQADRAEERLLDHCTNLGRWLDDHAERATAIGRLNDTLDIGTIAMLRRGLGGHPDARHGLRSVS